MPSPEPAVLAWILTEESGIILEAHGVRSWPDGFSCDPAVLGVILGKTLISPAPVLPLHRRETMAYLVN